MQGKAKKAAKKVGSDSEADMDISDDDDEWAQPAKLKVCWPGANLVQCSVDGIHARPLAVPEQLWL